MLVISTLCSALKTRQIHLYYLNVQVRTASRRTFSTNHQRLSLKQSVTENAARRIKTKTTMFYVAAVGILTAGFSYAAVPLYRMFCQVLLFSKINLLIIELNSALHPTPVFLFYT